MSKRLRQLDALRGLAICSILLYHYTTCYDDRYGHANTLPFKFPHGDYAVQLFFIMSGFVTIMTLLRHNNPWYFLVSRFARLYPAYCTALLLTYTTLCIIPLPDKQVSLIQAILNFTMLTTWLQVPYVDGVYWFLSALISFYAIMFVLQLSGLLRHLKKVMLVWLIMQLVSHVLQHHLSLRVPQSVEICLVLKFAHLFIAGMMFYKIKTGDSSFREYTMIACCVMTQWFITNSIDTIVISGLLLLFYLFVFDYLPFATVRPLVFLGTISYSLFLVHQNIGYVIIRQVYAHYSSPLTGIIVATAVSIVIAALITFYIERPAAKSIKDYYVRRRPLLGGGRA